MNVNILTRDISEKWKSNEEDTWRVTCQVVAFGWKL